MWFILVFYLQLYSEGFAKKSREVKAIEEKQTNSIKGKICYNESVEILYNKHYENITVLTCA
jgi:hypothetical protein